MMVEEVPGAALLLVVKLKPGCPPMTLSTRFGLFPFPVTRKETDSDAEK